MELTRRIIGCVIRVHQGLGPGFLENIYRRAMAIELRRAGLSIEVEREVVIYYGREEVGRHRMDLIVEGQVIVELKAVEKLSPIHDAQLLTYLRLTRRSLGLLINFNVPLLKDGLRRLRL